MKKLRITDGFVLSGLHMLNDGYLACLPLFLPFIRDDIPISLSQAGFLGSILNFSSIVLAFPSAYLGACLGSFHALGFAALFIFISYLTMFLAQSYTLVLVAFLAGSIGFGVFHPLAFAAVAKTNGNRLGREMGNFTANGDIGRIAFSVLLTVMIAKLSWSSTALIYSVLPLAVGIAVLTCRRYRKEAGHYEKKEKKEKILCRPPKRLAILLAAIFFDNFAVISLFLFLPFLFQAKGFDAAIIGSLTGVFFVGNYMGKIVCGRITEHKGVKKVFLVAELCLALTVYSLSVTDDLYMMIVLLAIMGILSKGTVPVLSTFLADTAKELEINIDGAYSIYSFITSTAQTVSPLVLGIAAATLGIEKLFVLCAGISGIAFVTGLFLKEPKKIPAENRD